MATLKLTSIDTETGLPLGRAFVLIRHGFFVRVKRTKTDGTITFDKLPVGEYTVRIKKIGYALQTEKVTLSPGVIVTREVYVERNIMGTRVYR